MRGFCHFVGCHTRNGVLVAYNPREKDTPIDDGWIMRGDWLPNISFHDNYKKIAADMFKKGTGKDLDMSMCRWELTDYPNGTLIRYNLDTDDDRRTMNEYARGEIEACAY